MLSIITAWIFIILPCMSVGLYVTHLCNLKLFFDHEELIVVALWTGIVILAISLLGTSLFVSVSPQVGLVYFFLYTIAPITSSRFRAEIKMFKSKPTLASCLAVALIVLMCAALTSIPITWHDTKLYHYQLIKWLSNYGSVPGLGLIHDRFGFVSSWFALSALFDAGVFEARLAPLLGGLSLLLAFIRLFLVLRRIFSNRARSYDTFVAACLSVVLFWAITGDRIAVSPSPDLPTALITVEVCLIIMVLIDRKGYAIDLNIVNSRLIPLILSAGAFAIKLSAAPLLAVTVIFYLQPLGLRSKPVILCMALCVIFFLPLMAASFTTTGCFIYPVKATCVDNLSWGVGSRNAEQMSLVIRDYARYGLESERPWPWLLNWMVDKHTSSLKTDALLLLLSLMSVIFLLAREHFKDGYEWVIAIGVLGVAFVMWSAPSYRFGVGYFCILPSVVIARETLLTSPLISIVPLSMTLLTPYIDLEHRRLRLVLLAISVSVYLMHLRKSLGDLALKATLCLACLMLLSGLFCVQPSLLVPPRIAAPPNVKYVPIQGDSSETVGISSEPCGSARIPCTPGLAAPNVLLRNAKVGIEAGFTRKP